MLKIPLIEAQTGMILAQDVRISGGNLLLNSSHVLSANSLELLSKHGINEIFIEPPEQESTEVSHTEDPLSFIQVHIAEDSMTASLTVEANLQISLTQEILKEALSHAGVVNGINEQELKKAVERWPTHKGMLQIEAAARGTSASPHHEGPFHMKVKHINSRSMAERINESHYAWEIEALAQKVERVDAGTLIAERSSGTPSVPGKNVRGELIFSEEIVEKKIIVESGASLSEDGLEVLATETGIAFFYEECIGVVPMDFNGSFELQLSSDKMSAQLIVHAPGDRGCMPSVEEVKKMLQDQQVTFGILEQELKNLFLGFDNCLYPKSPVVIARGQTPVNGAAGRVEFLFDTETSLKPKVNSNGVADYKNVDIIKPVAAGTRLIKLIAPEKGTDGIDITGKPISAQDGKAASLPGGANTTIDPSEPEYLVSSLDGVVKFNGISVDIQEGYVVEGDVDFSTGNVKYAKSVMINGDIKSGFTVECGGDLQVSGTIEDSVLNIGGNVLCKYGFIGQGKGVLESKGDVNLGFMKNQTVRSRGNVNIAREAINCKIFSRKSVHISGNPLSIAGGSVTAKISIIANMIGNASGIRTDLEVGLDYALLEEMHKIDEQLKELHENLRKITDTDKRFESMMKTGRQLSSQNAELARKVKETINRYTQQIHILDDRKNIASEKLYDHQNAFIKIERSAMPGTVFKICDRHLLVKDEIIGPKTVRSINHEIRVI